MTTAQIILVVAVIAVVVLLAAIGTGGGPKVTQIDRTIKKDQSEGGER
jgi:hypothetical protein